MGVTAVVWRHGETDWNAEGRWQGRASDIELNTAGIAQARAAAPWIARLNPTRIVASPMKRAQATAAALAELTGLEPVTEDRIAEVSVGEYEGKTYDEVMATDPDYLRAFAEGRDYRYSATGESVSEVGTRVADAINDWAGRVDDDEVIVFACHGMAARSGITFLLGLDASFVGQLGKPRNCSWAVLNRLNPGRWCLEAYQQTAPDNPPAD